MGKKRIATSTSGEDTQKQSAGSSQKKIKKQLIKGVIYVTSSYNNTIVSITDNSGNVCVWSSAGSIGFKGTRKSTPYAATLVSKDAIEKAKRLGIQEAKVVISGIGPGREGAIRGIAGSGINVTSIVDSTPIPHNGVKPPKPRRV
ncbi:MAG: small subunit ribosomal protein S11 [Parcubacteria group bacterium Licking1014_17]|nr:MAG: small subunit ribosomal protein S11 [Parcubacteria group bacterium Licking1014_17]